MIVECINNDEAKAPDVFANGYRHPEYVHTELTVGASYVVYGIGVYKDDLKYLIRTDLGDGRWKSPYFFEVRDDRLPPYWKFRYNVIEGAEPLQRIGWRAVSGYSELVDDPAHNEGLMELHPEAYQVFEREVARRAELGY
ncbi:MAG: hypothetical protein ACOH14_13450 [Rhodoglobus sp.]